MVVFTYSNVNEASKAEIVIIGVPDEKKSHSKRKGTSKGPDVLRMVNNESNFFERGGSTIPICPMRGNIVEKYIFDYGNVKKEELYRIVFQLVSNKKSSNNYRRGPFNYINHIKSDRRFNRKSGTIIF